MYDTACFVINYVKMKKSSLLILFLMFLMEPLFARDLVCEVSSRFKNTQVSNGKMRFSSIEDAFEYTNNYNDGNRIQIVLLDGQYYTNKSLILKNRNGVIIRAKHGRAIIASGNEVMNYQQKNDTVIFPYSDFVSKIFVDGETVRMSSTFTTAGEMKQYKSFKELGNNKYSVIFPKEELKKMEEGCDVFVYCRWLCHKLQVRQINCKTGEVIMHCDFNPSYASDATAYYTIYNSRKAMKPGAFCYSNGHVYYLKREGEGSRLSIRVPNVSTIMAVEDCNSVIIENVTFSGVPADEWYVQGVQGARNLSKAVMVKNSSGISFKDCDFNYNDGYSLGIDNSKDCAVQGCSFMNLGGGGVALGFGDIDETHDIKIENNLFKGLGRIHAGSEAIISYKAHDVSITYNTICDCYYTGIGLGFTWGYGDSYSYNNYVANNHIHHVMRGVLSDGAGIYTLGNQHGTVIEYNYVHDVISRVYTASGSSLLYFDNGSSNAVARNNVMFGAHTGFHENYGRRNTLEGNVIAYTNLVAFRLSNAELDTMLVTKNNYVMIDKGAVYNDLFALHATYINNKILGGESINCESEIKIDNFYNEVFTSLKVRQLHRLRLLKKSFKYGVKYKRLKEMAELSDAIISEDKRFVINNFAQVSDYFVR